jgi:predicted nucleotidyltransferase
MTPNDFDAEEAKKFLLERDKRRREEREKDRQEMLQKVTLVLREKFAHTSVEVFLVGSITRPYSFSSHSDVDVVLKNYQGDRFSLWSELEEAFGRSVEIISFETCSFQKFVAEEGLKVV